MKKRGLRLFCGLLAALVTVALWGCAPEKGGEMERPVYDEGLPSRVVRLTSYEGLEIPLAEGESKSEAVWREILSRAEILSYPEEAVSYYAEQSRETYRYYAEKNDWSYEDALERLGTSEEAILADAREMVKGDLVYRYIVEKAGISLTEAEVERLFDRYAEKFAEDYGKEIDEVKDGMADLIRESMLYDKTMEYLILRNRFVAAESET